MDRKSSNRLFKIQNSKLIFKANNNGIDMDKSPRIDFLKFKIPDTIIQRWKPTIVGWKIFGGNPPKIALNLLNSNIQGWK